MTSVLILGNKGMLGGQLQKLYPRAVCWDREDVDVTDFPALREKILGLGFIPPAIVNCIAFNDVDGAEENADAAFALNANYVRDLAQLSRQIGSVLVHYSTNYVFDGRKGEYAEDDTPAPLSVYGNSKLRGERLVAEFAGHYYLIRTAVIFGPKGASDLSKKSFVDLMLHLAARPGDIRAVEDEVNSVTYAPDLAAATQRLLVDRPAPGIYHVTNSGGVSWFEFAKEIFRIAGKNVTVLPVPSSHFPRKAQRPGKAILLNTKLPAMRSWQSALAEFLSQRSAQG
jgi:dTDP-4-dehydrorhamnose reductase